MSTYFLPLLRALAESYQAFDRYSAAHIRQTGLTPPQFDIIATLGNTQGMSCKELSEKTLITKGTLTGVIDRLLEKGLVSRTAAADDRRSLQIALTQQGEQLFLKVFPAHLAHIDRALCTIGPEQLQRMRDDLQLLTKTFNRSLEKS